MAVTLEHTVKAVEKQGHRSSRTDRSLAQRTPLLSRGAPVPGTRASVPALEAEGEPGGVSGSVWEHSGLARFKRLMNTTLKD